MKKIHPILLLFTTTCLLLGSMFAVAQIEYSISAIGRTQLYVSNGQETVGINPSTNQQEDSLASAIYLQKARSAEIYIGSTIENVLNVKVFGTSNEVVKLEIEIQNFGTGKSQSASFYVLQSNNEISIDIEYDGSSNQLSLVGPVDPVDIVLVTANNGKVELNWDIVSDTRVDSYNIYHRSNSAPVFEFVGSTPTTTYLTSDDIDSPADYKYIILSANSEGLQSYYLEQFGDTPNAKILFSASDNVGGSPHTVDFENLSQGDFISWEWDFNSDGTVDSTDFSTTYTYAFTGYYDVTLRGFTSTTTIERTLKRFIVVDDDLDKDGIADLQDNCLQVGNSNQIDTDSDGYGNACDADLNNDLIVNSLDLGLFKQEFLSSGIYDADLNGDGIVNALDTGIFKSLLFNVPGPSAVAP